MASQKLAQAVALGKVVVKNVCTGEVALHVNGTPYNLAYGQTLDLTALVPAAQVRSIGGLEDLLRDRDLVIV